jgi:electron transfer flavoprotein beta subunit
MNILVLLRMVPDVVEELEITPDGKALDTEYLRMIINESDDHALEQALILKEQHGGKVTVLALEAPDVDDVLFTAVAKGVDRVIKIERGEGGLTTRCAAGLFAGAIKDQSDLQPFDMVLTGVQAIDDLDALIAPILSQRLGLPYLGIVTKVTPEESGKSVTAIREFSAGVRGAFEIPLPAVLGIQAAEKPPRYVPVAKVRLAMKSHKIESVAAATMADGGPPLLEVTRMRKPEVSGHAEMLDGAPEDVAKKLADIFSERGLL